MALIVNRGTGGDFEPAPAGPTAARCCDVRDLGMIESVFSGKPKTQHKLLVSWVIGQEREDGKPFIVSKRYTASLHEKAALRADLESWRGKAFTESELDAFDVETVIGAPCFLNVVHNKKDGRVFANVQSIMPLPKGMQAPSVPTDYVRWVDRAEHQQAAANHAEPPPPDDHDAPGADDEIPF